MRPHVVEAFGESKSVLAWSTDPRVTVTRRALMLRLARGVPAEEALTAPPATAGSGVGNQGVLYEAFGERKTLVAWAEDPRAQVSRTGLRQRLAKGQTLEEALSGVRLRDPDFGPKEAFGESRLLVEWAADPRFDVSYQAIVARLARGMTLAEALTTVVPCPNLATYEAFGEHKTLVAWAADDRSLPSKASTLFSRIHKQGMTVEEALSRPYPPLYAAFGEDKTLAEWIVDPRCPLEQVSTLHWRIHKQGMPVEQAIERPTSEWPSYAETRLAAFLAEEGVRFIANDRQVIRPRELDLYLPDHGIAIEYNGIYWHSERYVEREFHHGKWKSCRAAGVQLVQVWEDDYRARPEVVHQMLRHKLGLSTERVFARSTTVAIEDAAVAQEFLDAFHIQGATTASVHVGLRSGDALVAVCSFKREPDDHWELTRYATSTSVVGGFTKCLAHFTRNQRWAQVKTFADHCVSDGGLYLRAGFADDGEIPPDYRYVVDGRRVHKFGYRIDRFRRDPGLEFAEGLTEADLAALNNIPRIWDAGKTRWVLRNPSAA